MMNFLRGLRESLGETNQHIIYINIASFMSLGTLNVTFDSILKQIYATYCID